MLIVFLISTSLLIVLRELRLIRWKCLLINGIDQLCFEHDDIDTSIWNSVEGVN